MYLYTSIYMQLGAKDIAAPSGRSGVYPIREVAQRAAVSGWPNQIYSLIRVMDLFDVSEKTFWR
jgi:hypothetical protein